MKTIKISILILISSVFTKNVVADTTELLMDTIENYEKIIVCNTDTIKIYKHTTSSSPYAWISPNNVGYDDYEHILITQNQVLCFNGTNYESFSISTQGTWRFEYNAGFNNIYFKVYFTSPISQEPWPTDTTAICGSADTLYAGNDSYQEGVYFKWENITDGTVLAEGYYNNDTSLIVNQTASYAVMEKSGCNIVYDTIFAKLTPNTPPNLGPDYSVCGAEFQEILHTTEQYDIYSWMDGDSTGSTYFTTQPGTYWVYAENNCVSGYDTITIEHKVYPWLFIGDDHNICDNSTETLDMGFDYDVMSWNKIVGSDTSWIQDTRTLNISSAGTFLAYARMTGCESMTDDIVVSVVYPYENNEIGVVTVDTSGHNKIVWEKTYGFGIDYYNIYHLNIDYELIGSVSMTEEPVFYDMQSDPVSSAHRYKISAVDTCGNESSLSMYHGTIHITSTPSTDGGLDLTVTDPYMDESGNFQPDRYYILIDSINNGHYSVVDSISISFNSYHVVSPLSGASYLMAVGSPVEVIDSSKTKVPAINNLSISNKTSPYVSVNEISKMKFNIYPNPANKTIVIDFEEHINNKEMRIEISDITGKVVYEKIKLKQHETVDVSGFGKGIYFVKIRQENKLFEIKKLLIE